MPSPNEPKSRKTRLSPYNLRNIFNNKKSETNSDIDCGRGTPVKLESDLSRNLKELSEEPLSSETSGKPGESFENFSNFGASSSREKLGETLIEQLKSFESLSNCGASPGREPCDPLGDSSFASFESNLSENKMTEQELAAAAAAATTVFLLP